MKSFLLDTSNGTQCLILHVRCSALHVSGPEFMAYFGKIQWATGSRQAGTQPTNHDLHIISPVVVWSDSITLIESWAQSHDQPQLGPDFIELYPDTDANRQMVRLLILMQCDREKHRKATESLKELVVELIAETLKRSLPAAAIKQLVDALGAGSFLGMLRTFLNR